MLVPLRLPVAVACVGLLGLPSVASATKVIAPPGNSGVSQYVEVVPGASGSVPVGTGGSHGPVLSAAQRHSLEAAGSSGKALAAFAQQTGVPRSKLTASGAGTHKGAGAGKHGSSLPGAALAAAPVRSTAATGGGLGWGFYAALGAILLAGLGLLLARNRAS